MQRFRRPNWFFFPQTRVDRLLRNSPELSHNNGDSLGTTNSLAGNTPAIDPAACLPHSAPTKSEVARLQNLKSQEKTMNTLNRILSKMKLQILTAALLISVAALLPSLSFAHNTAGGCDDGKSGKTISKTSDWTNLCKKKIVLTDGTHDCVATGSAYVTNNNLVNGHNNYLFTLSTDPNPKTGQAGEMKIDVTLDPNSFDPEQVPVSAVQHFDNLSAGTYTFRWLARPDIGKPAIEVTRFAMGVVCTDGK
jgi:hypothetical protein